MRYTLLFLPCSAIRYVVRQWPPDMEIGKSLVKHHFRREFSSQSICLKFFAPWWNDYWPRRLTSSRLDLLAGLGLVFPGPKPYEHHPPVQSIEAHYLRPKGRPSNEFLKQGRQYETRKTCVFGCEDLRVTYELWLSASIDPQQQVRDKGWITMICPDGYHADLVQEPDLREEENEVSAAIDAKIKEVVDHQYLGPWTYHSRLPAHPWDPSAPRSTRFGRTETVSQCVCMPDEEDMDASSECSDVSSEEDVLITADSTGRNHNAIFDTVIFRSE